MLVLTKPFEFFVFKIITERYCASNWHIMIIYLPSSRLKIKIMGVRYAGLILQPGRLMTHAAVGKTRPGFLPCVCK